MSKTPKTPKPPKATKTPKPAPRPRPAPHNSSSTYSAPTPSYPPDGFVRIARLMDRMPVVGFTGGR